ncbi:MAG: hypothetical protein IJM90_08325 [Firmicutes bacterium]|nr:hypothetical protein [Bacillota bacterium]
MMSFLFFAAGYALTMLDLMGNYTDILPDTAGCLLMLVAILILARRRRVPRFTPLLPGLSLVLEVLLLIFSAYFLRLLAIILHAALMWILFRAFYPERAKGSLAQIRFHTLVLAQAIILFIKAGAGLLTALPGFAIAALILQALLVIYVIVTGRQNWPGRPIE